MCFENKCIKLNMVSQSNTFIECRVSINIAFFCCKYLIATPLPKKPNIFKIVSYKSFLDFYLGYKNVCLKFLRKKLQKLEIIKIDTISSNLHFFLISTKLKNVFRKIFYQSFAPKYTADVDLVSLNFFSIQNQNHQFSKYNFYIFYFYILIHVLKCS